MIYSILRPTIFETSCADDPSAAFGKNIKRRYNIFMAIQSQLRL
jgi:hypothetical protein